MSQARPRLADVSCQPVRFQPGDRLIVRTPHRLSAEDRKRLHQTVSRWAGGAVEVLIVELPLFDVAVDKAPPIILP